MKTRILFILATVLCSVPLFAQNEISVFLNRASFSSTSFTDPDIGALKVKFDAKAGYGIGIGHAISPSVSADFTAQRLRADAKLELGTGASSLSVPIGDIDLRQYDAALQWHFIQSTGRFDPYVGGGIAYLHGGKLNLSGSPEDDIAAVSVHLDNKFTWLADAGINLRVTPSTAVNLSAKYIGYKTGIEADPSDPIQSLKLDPLTINLGLRWRY